MRKLKLQMFMSIDGFVAKLDEEAPEAEPTPEKPSETDIDQQLQQYLMSTIASSDTILLGRKMSEGFITYWENMVNHEPEHPEFPLAKLLVDTPKVIFTKTLTESKWDKTTLATGDLVEEVNKLKNRPGKDMIVYGGGGFVSSLIKAGLIDEYHIFINPNALGKGMPIFNLLSKQQDFTLKGIQSFRDGIALLVYEPKRD